jgi:hypothetical protein
MSAAEQSEVLDDTHPFPPGRPYRARKHVPAEPFGYPGRVGPLLDFVDRRLLGPFPRGREQPLLIHSCYHRAGTVWFQRILSEVAYHYGLLFEVGDPAARTRARVFLDVASYRDPELAGVRGSHIVRDPRDMVVSGYFYHLWTREVWAHVRYQRFQSRTYQQYLNSLSQEDGVFAEMDRTCPAIERMVSWDYGNPAILELRYEEVLANERESFARLFRHYGFTDRAIRFGLRVARRFSFERRSGRPLGKVEEGSHLRSGQPGQWRQVFTPAHIRRFKERHGDALIQLGYEKSYDW